MFGRHKPNRSSWSITVTGGSEEEEAHDDLLRWCNVHDVQMEEAPRTLQDISSKLLTAANIIDKPVSARPRKPKEELPIFEFWNQWYTVLRGKFPEIIKPKKIPGEEARHIKMLLQEYGRDTIIEIFKLAVLDWDVLRAKYVKLPAIPTLRSVIYNRSELAAGVASKGLTSAKQRVSEYGKTAGAYDDWKMKK